MASVDKDPTPTAAQLQRWRAGDDSAFAALHDRFAPLLRARVRRNPAWSIVQARLQLDDVLQEIWMRATPAVRRRFADFGSGSLLAFLGTIADRAVVSLARTFHARKRGQRVERVRVTDFEVDAGVQPGHSPPESPTSRARLREIVRIAREELGEREFEAWDLVELQHYSPEEVGLAMGCTASAVRGLLLRSRSKLVSRLGRKPAK
jgi:RNA polymerase sigma factor (sigma-70 family)